MKVNLMKLALEHIKQLSLRVGDLLHDRDKWRDPPLSEVDKNNLGLDIKTCLGEQQEWIRAIVESLEDDN